MRRYTRIIGWKFAGGNGRINSGEKPTILGGGDATIAAGRSRRPLSKLFLIVHSIGQRMW
jgi:hypothetical protein